MAMSPHSQPARPRRWLAWSAWALWALAVLGLATVPWFDHLLRQARRPELTQLGASTIPYLLAVVIAATAGAVLASRRPAHPVGWLLLALGLSVTAWGVAVFSPGTLFVGLACVGFVLLLTPTGSLPSPRWRWWARLAAAAPAGFLLALTVGPGLVIPPYESAVDPVAVPALAGAVRITIATAFVLTAGALAVGAWSLVVRFRHARGIERQQLRWIAFAAALTGVAAAVVLAGMALGPRWCSCWRSACAWRSCRWQLARRSCATGCTTWTASSAERWPTGCSRCCWAVATPGWSWGSGSCLVEARAWRWRWRPWRWPRRSSRPAAGSSGWSTGASTGAATTPPARSSGSAPGCASSSTWTP